MNPDEQKSSRFRKLKYKSKYIELDYNETREIFLEAKKEWVEAIITHCKENDIPNPLTQDPPGKKAATEQEDLIFSSTQIKDLYRKIVILTHPDKLINKPKSEAEKKQALYNKATKAKNKKDVDSLLKIAVELEIDLSHLDMRCLDLLENQLNKKEAEIKKMREDIAWHWYYAGKNRNQMISKICPKPNKEV